MNTDMTSVSTAALRIFSQCEKEGYITKQLQYKYDKELRRELRSDYEQRLQRLKNIVATSMMQLVLLSSKGLVDDEASVNRYIYTCIYMCLCIFIDIDMYIYVYIYIYKCTYIHMCIYTYLYFSLRFRARTCLVLMISVWPVYKVLFLFVSVRLFVCFSLC